MVGRSIDRSIELSFDRLTDRSKCWSID